VPLPRSLARFNRRATNKVFGPLARVTKPWAIVVHEGRKTGRVYETPVWAFRTDTGYVIALTYGAGRTEWLRNVIASGSMTLRVRSESHRLTNPRVVRTEEGIAAMPAGMRPILRTLRIRDYLILSSARNS
jgi:deazaflavin-dependent oxidoreductase (nitroreductase family)